jgi:NAD+ synthase
MNSRPADRLNITVAQLNPIVGDVAGNLEKARRARALAAADRADLIVFTELFIAGYPPEDLVLKPAFQAACRAAIEALARDTADGGPAVLIGTPWIENDLLYNAVVLLDAGAIAAVRLKVNLPNYGVFDERRIFAVCGLGRRSAKIFGPSGVSMRMWSNAWLKPAPSFSLFPTVHHIAAPRMR